MPGKKKAKAKKTAKASKAAEAKVKAWKKSAAKPAPVKNVLQKKALRASKEAAPTAETKEKAGERKARIMVVDDEEMILLLVSEILKHEGFSVTTAKSGMECMDRLEHEKPDLLILDVMMNRITGLDVAEAVRLDPRLRDVKIIFLTVVKSTEIKPELLGRLGVSDYITKPFNNSDLIRRVKWALMKK
jgi:CheY-like chemotaxis protein